MQEIIQIAASYCAVSDLRRFIICMGKSFGLPVSAA